MKKPIAGVNSAIMTREILKRVSSKLPCRIIPDPRGVETYLERYYFLHEAGVFLEGDFDVMLHCFKKGDEDRELHNHPWDTCASIILYGGYEEEYNTATWEVDIDNPMREGRLNWKRKPGEHKSNLFKQLYPGDVSLFNGQTHFHRVELLEKECWTIFIVGKRVDTWGFMSTDGTSFTPWREWFKERGLPFPKGQEGSS